ncbi:MAG: 50S ribosomal protein L3 [Candidatus Babeliales bacterium]
MLNNVLGKKVGMTQIFAPNGKIFPVTVIDIADLFVTQIKTTQNEGYSALQLGILRNRYKKKSFSVDWLKNKKKYFCFLREVLIEVSDSVNFTLGQKINFDGLGLQTEDIVKVTGTSKGQGYQGVVKRWGFGGGPDSHGSNFHRRPGAIGSLRTQGEVIKGKKLPGQKGNDKITVQGLKIIHIDKENSSLFVKGAVPGKNASLVTICKQG